MYKHSAEKLITSGIYCADETEDSTFSYSTTVMISRLMKFSQES